MSPPLPPAQVPHLSISDNSTPGSQFDLGSLLVSQTTAASTPAEQGVCDRTAPLSPERFQALTPERRQQQAQAQCDGHSNAKRQRCRGRTLTSATATPPQGWSSDQDGEALAAAAQLCYSVAAKGFLTRGVGVTAAGQFLTLNSDLTPGSIALDSQAPLSHMAEQLRGGMYGAVRDVHMLASEHGIDAYPEVMLHLYRAFVMPHAMFGCQVWGRVPA
jgi:hypothetical protein